MAPGPGAGGAPVLCCPDKFRGTLGAQAAADALVRGVEAAGLQATMLPLSDGGEGFLDVFGGPNRVATVAGPLGTTVEAPFRRCGDSAWLESAAAIGLALAGGRAGNDPMGASSRGLGELMLAAVESGAKRLILGLGGSATTDGGLGALEALRPFHRLRGIEILVACDVQIRFVDAAERFAAQKGASGPEIALLTQRLEGLSAAYRREFGVDGAEMPGGGAAGGVAGALAALGAELVPGFELVAEETRLAERIDRSGAVITGEGRLDEGSFDGKVVGGVLGLAEAGGRPAAAIVGSIDPGVFEVSGAHCGGGRTVIALADRFGEHASMERTPELLARSAAEWCRSSLFG